ncbi:MAG TPA: nucleotidyltransferase family protein, partial [Polyangiaceae bacterium]|nr:nucleotidyltransferase family protein [Polyangiaceae bacterium]
MTPELANNLKVKAELLEVSRAFAAQGIDHLVLKGVPLVLSLYQQLDARWIGDNDLLIQSEDQQRAIDVLQGLGYRSKRDAATSLRYDGRATFRRSGAQGEAIVDLHCKAFEPLLFAVPEDLVWQQREQVDLGGYRVSVLNREFTVLHQAAHCAQHAMMEPRALRDFARAWNEWGGGLDLTKMEEVARSYGLLDAFMFGLWVAQDLGMLLRAPPSWPAPRAQRLRRVLSTRRLLRAAPEMPYLRMASMGVL